jgi:hypothetical protein
VRLESRNLLDTFDDYPFALLEGVVNVLLEVGVVGEPLLDTPVCTSAVLSEGGSGF